MATMGQSIVHLRTIGCKAFINVGTETRTNMKKAAQRGAHILPRYKEALSSQVNRTASRHSASRPEAKAMAFTIVQGLYRQRDSTAPTRW
ncbi:unnamed protein product [Fusarium venenatum]|uniref:Uncharacterized protein n=1 Tax=Fusarium venenatum TaxID=56646 RepID=A0A2L2TBC5_9HYPO|nr:uncharacterized protein FVRRES_03870 [Fusarium venenatum]CEI67358.1 unnamed protein product [Fusarium venenatum]